MLRFLRDGISFALFRHVTPLIRLGGRKILESSDFPELPARLEPTATAAGFDTLPLTGVWAFLFAVIKANRSSAVAMGLCLLGCGATGLASPALIHALISFVGNAATEPLWYGLLLGVGLCLLSATEAVLLQNFFYNAITSKIMVINGLNQRIYRHTLALTRKSRLATPIGDAVNHLGTDSDAVAEFVWVVIEMSYSLAMIVSVTAFLFQYLGIAALAGVAVLTVMTPLTKKVAKGFTRLDDEIMKHRDERVSQISQMLSGIRIVKFFAWGDKILGDIRAIRDKEVGARKRLARAGSAAMLIYVGAGTLVCLAAFGTFLALGHKLDAATVFPCLALFGMLEHPFGNLTRYISDTISAKVSAGRLLEFLRRPTLAPDDRPVSAPSVPIGVSFEAVIAGYEDAEHPAVAAAALVVAPGESVAIVGPVGSGKTSLLLAVLGELPLKAGTVTFAGLAVGEAPRTAFVPQEAFVQNGTLAQNIHFGEPEADLGEAVRMCALGADLAQLPAGLGTEIGEHGVNLSGGQKQRVSLARAVMARPGLVLLDDPLSAVDATTEAFLARELIFGHWAGVTRLVVTHRLEHLGQFDKVVFVEKGLVSAVGTYEELRRTVPRFEAFMVEHETSHGAGTAFTADARPEAAADGKAKAPQEGNGGRITAEEDRERGAVKPRVYLDYLRALGGRTQRSQVSMLPLLFGAVLGVTVIPILQNTWLSVWTGGDATGGVASWMTPHLGSDYRNLMIFGALGLVALVVGAGQNLLWGTRAVMAGRDLHDRALRAVLGAPVRFFDSTPIGRILNRFSQDVDAIERNLPWSFEHTVRGAFLTLGSIAVLVTILPLTIVVVVPVILLFLKVQAMYRRCAREAQRLYSISRSPRFAHFKETLNGLSVIRGLHKGDWFTARFLAVTRQNQRDLHGLISLNRWFSVRVPLVGSLVSLSVALGIVVAAHGGAISAGLAGLVLIYALRFWESLNWAVRSFAEVESRMTSVERLRTYGMIAQEPALLLPEPVVAAGETWPLAGTIEFCDVFARYAEHLPDVLKGVSFRIPGGSKAGLIGRTGSGKSTVFQALFRFIEARSGTILIDGKDIGGIPIDRLRRSIAIIPQDPTLFRGKLRENLDRFAQHTDSALWRALDRAHLKAFAQSLPGGLEAEVKENGQNFSQGQRQLFCLARALLVDARVIVMDEATASVDVETDALIQETIRRECGDRTVLIIAHRLGTVEDCDLVIDLDDGRVRRVLTPDHARRIALEGASAAGLLDGGAAVQARRVEAAVLWGDSTVIN